MDEDFGLLRAREFKGKVLYEDNPKRVNFADVLRVHDYQYIRKIQHLCTSIPDEPTEVANIDDDTTVSHRSYESALRAAGAVISAVDKGFIHL